MTTKDENPVEIWEQYILTVARVLTNPYPEGDKNLHYFEELGSIINTANFGKCKIGEDLFKIGMICKENHNECTLRVSKLNKDHYIP